MMCGPRPRASIEDMRSGSETASTPTSTVSDPHLSMIRHVGCYVDEQYV
jgi:hypothetical protein